LDIKRVELQQIKIEKNAGNIAKKDREPTLPTDSVSIGNEPVKGRESAKGNEPTHSRNSIKINILHLNDVHGAVEPVEDPESTEGPVGGVAYVKTVIDQEREKNPDGTMTLNAGDIAEGTMVSYVTRGRIVTDAFNRIRFDAVALGNHDFEWGKDELKTIVQDLNSPVVAANVVKTDDGIVFDGAKPYIMKNVKGINIAIIGLDTPDTVRYVDKDKIEGIRFEDTAATMKKYIPEVKAKGADIVILLSHLGFKADKELAKNVKGIDVIVGGHSHTELPEGYREGDTIIVQAGSQGRFVGNLGLELDPSSKKITGHHAELIPIKAKDIEPDPDILNIITPYLKAVDQKGSEVMGHAGEDLHYAYTEAAKLNQIFTDSLWKASGADIGLCSAKMLRGHIKRGEVTYKSLYGAFPLTEEKLFTVRTTGRKIITEIENRLKDGSRGIRIPAGFTYKYDTTRPEGERITSITTADGKPLNPDKEYTVAMNTSVATGKFFADAEEKKEIGKCQEIFFDHFRNNSPWRDDPDERVKASK